MAISRPTRCWEPRDCPSTLGEHVERYPSRVDAVCRVRLNRVHVRVALPILVVFVTLSVSHLEAFSIPSFAVNFSEAVPGEARQVQGGAEDPELLASAGEVRLITPEEAHGLQRVPDDADVRTVNLGVTEMFQHAAIAAVRFRYDVQLGKMLDTGKITGQHLRPYLRVADVQWGTVNVDDLPLMDFDDESRGRFCLVLGDLLINEGGSYPGRSAIWLGELDECYYQKALHRLRSHSPTRDSTLFFLLRHAVGDPVRGLHGGWK